MTYRTITLEVGDRVRTMEGNVGIVTATGYGPEYDIAHVRMEDDGVTIPYRVRWLRGTALDY
jgi:hypothetical protein